MRSICINEKHAILRIPPLCLQGTQSLRQLGRVAIKISDSTKTCLIPGVRSSSNNSTPAHDKYNDIVWDITSNIKESEKSIDSILDYTRKTNATLYKYLIEYINNIPKFTASIPTGFTSNIVESRLFFNFAPSVGRKTTPWKF